MSPFKSPKLTNTVEQLKLIAIFSLTSHYFQALRLIQLKLKHWHYVLHKIKRHANLQKANFTNMWKANWHKGNFISKSTYLAKFERGLRTPQKLSAIHFRQTESTCELKQRQFHVKGA